MLCIGNSIDFINFFEFNKFFRIVNKSAYLDQPVGGVVRSGGRDRSKYKCGHIIGPVMEEFFTGDFTFCRQDR